jgi:hypothetical protein
VEAAIGAAFGIKSIDRWDQFDYLRPIAAVFSGPDLFRLNGRKRVGDFSAVMGYMAARQPLLSENGWMREG